MRILNMIAMAALAVASAANAQTMGGQTMDHSTMDNAAHMKMMADAQRQAGVSERGKDVMPFSLPATMHIFSKNAQGGTQQVIAKKADDVAQVKLVRQHLQEIRA